MSVDQRLTESIASLEKARAIIADPHDPSHVASAVARVRLAIGSAKEAIVLANRLRVAWNKECARQSRKGWHDGSAAKVVYLKEKDAQK